MLIATLSLLMFSKMEACPTSLLRGASSPVYTPIMSVPAGVDKNHNGVENSLDQEIADRLANGTAQEYVNVTVMLKSQPTPHDLNLFLSSGGYLTTSPWTYAIYGFGGRIPYDDIDVFAENCPDVLLIEKEAVCQESIAYAAEQVGVRSYVWSTVGLQGDPNSSIAVLDTGIDGSQVDFSPGYGNQNFSDKIVGWMDEVGNTTSPVDDNGHGSDVSGLAAGDGFFSTDASGNAIATWGANLGSVSSTASYLVTGMMVNKTGTITLKVEWASTGTATLRALQLYYGDKNLSSGSWTLVNSTLTLLQNYWWPVTYNVASTPSGGYDMYHVELAEGQGTGNLYVVITMSWPYTPPSDGFSAWTGIAPQAKLVGVKVLNSTGSGTSTELINGINWIIANRQTYHITVASMSLGFSSEVSAVDDAVVNLVNSGVCTVVAAGNNGAGGNYIFTPGSVDEAITVAAMNQFDDVASYSSQGGPSMSTGNTTKPDIMAPGGSFFGVPLFSAASNDNDAEGGFGDIQANDSAPMQGTSMATSIVAGAVDIVEQAMGGYSVWNWTRSQALLPKMILLMTATQTYPNLREGDTTGAYSPTLNPGGTDAQEGYGRLNLDAAVDAVLKTYQVGTTVLGSLGMPPTPSNISVLGESLAWARNVQLVSGLAYNFTLSVPSGANYDLFLYNSTGTYYGDPAIVANSTTSGNGGTETFNVTAPYTGTYYLVVKRATETTGSGTFNLTSSGPVYVTFSQTGVSSDFTGTVVTIDGVNYGYSSLPQSFWWNNGSSHTFAYSSPLLVSANQKQYVLTGVNETSPLTVSNNETVTGTYKTQYYITFSQTGANSDFTSAVMNIDGSNYTVGTLPVGFWYDNGSSHTFVYQSPLVATAGQKQYVWTSTSGLSSLQSGSITVSGSGTVTGTYKTQYYVTFGQTGVSSDFAGTVVTINGTGYGLTGYSGWADSGSTYNFAYSTPLLVSANQKQYVLTGVNETSPLTVSNNAIVTGTYETQWYITFAQSAVGADFNGTVVVVDGVNFNASGASFWWDDQSIHSFSFQSPLIAVANAKCYVWNSTTGLLTQQSDGSFEVTTSGSATGNYETQWYITVVSAYGAPTASGWVNNGADFTASVTSPTEIVAGDYQWVCTGFSIDGAASTPGMTYTFLNVQAAHSVGFSWEEQFWIEVDSTLGSPTNSQWVDEGTNFTASVTSPTEIVAGDYQWVCTGFSIDGAASTPGMTYTFLNVQATHAIVFSWNEQFWIEVNSAHDTPTESQWEDQGSSLTVSVTSPADDNGAGTRYRCTGYTLDNNPPVTDGSTSFEVVNIQSAHTITFNWIAQYNILFNQTGVGTDFSGTIITIDGANYGLTGVNTLPASFWWDDGSSHNFLFSDPLIVNASVEYSWVSTTGLILLQSGALTVASSGTVIGNYGPEELINYTLNVSTVGSGSVGLNASGPCHYGDVVQCTAVPVAGWNFVGWSGNLSGYADPATLTITGNMSVSATFTLNPVLQTGPTNETCRIYGQNFNVTVQLPNAVNVEEFDFEIDYNATLLSVVDVSWNAWGSGTYNLDSANGNLSGYTSGSPINGSVTLVTVTFSATYYHIWKDIPGWTNDLTGTIYIQWANLSSSSGPELGYIRGGSQNQITVTQDITYTFSPIQGDLNNDGTVNIFDLRTMAAFYGQQNPMYDLLGHGTIDIFDLVLIAANFGYTYSP